MKHFIILLTSLCFLNFSQLLACDIEVSTPAKKAVYQAGEELVIVVHVTKSHRNCRVDINETTYETDGLKILSATDWKELSAGVWERKMKVKVTGNMKGKPSLYVRRKCSKENSEGFIVLNSTSQNVS
ncbi:hypothetical protein OCK74_09270 [Chitinophagaceae bacterium LB-8]|uniref:Uncharacterized protein n=1 Tax=Paraflavisolibacter caeni TaxID=2982496 RepID=A0A9X2XU74_9BACT|nr:hypothetical protein [Paraflavisolibacter caeni]MCU7549304.1 hypothetical protein [Paraflavisolibacter caeni]